MSLLLTERTVTVEAALLLPGAAMPVTCRLTAEWLRGVTDPTWYGYLIPSRSALRLLPGQYRLRFQGETLTVLIRRATKVDQGWYLPFWGVGRLPRALEPALPTPDQGASTHGDNPG